MVAQKVAQNGSSKSSSIW